MRMYRPPAGEAASADLGDKLGGGGEGGVYALQGLPLLAAKLYPERNRTPHRQAKIEAMIAAPPSPITMLIDRINEPLLAWPTQLLTEDDGRFAGFVMARIDRSFTGLNHFLRGQARGGEKLADADRSLPSRLAGARNLARLVQSVHERGHLVIDLNAPNIRVQRKSMVVCILDCDSFAVARNGRIEFAPTAMREEGLAPEFQGQSLASLRFAGEAQDRFALAVLVFQWLNRGIHPFQGVLNDTADPDAAEPRSLQYFIQRRRYGYGLTRHDEIQPFPHSAHDTFPPALRQLFDSAFSATDTSERPSAKQWVKVLEDLKTDRHLRRCERMPDNVLHIHFKGALCPQCRLEQLAGSPSTESSLGPSSASISQVPGTSVNSAAASDAGAPPPRADGIAQAGAGSTTTSVPSSGGASSALKPGGKRRLLFAFTITVLLIGLLVIFAGAGPPAATPVLVPPTPEVRAPAPKPISPEEQDLARAMSGADDEVGIKARSAVLNNAMTDASRNNLAVLLQWTRQVVGAPLPEVEERAKSRQIDQAHLGAVASWTRFRRAARDLHDQQAMKAFAAGDNATAATLALRALALDPQDVEIAGNLAEFEARAGDRPEAEAALIYAMSLRTQQTGRSTDWQLLGNLQAMSGAADVAEGAYTVALAITSKPDRLCRNMRDAIARYGNALHAPLAKVAARFGEARGATTACSLD